MKLRKLTLQCKNPQFQLIAASQRMDMTLIEARSKLIKSIKKEKVEIVVNFN